jgi:hypothetical protein
LTGSRKEEKEKEASSKIVWRGCYKVKFKYNLSEVLLNYDSCFLYLKGFNWCIHMNVYGYVKYCLYSRAIGGEVTSDGDFLLFENNRYTRKGFLFKSFVMSAIVSTAKTWWTCWSQN